MIEVRTDKTGSLVVGQCDYNLQLSAPQGTTVWTGTRLSTRWLYQLPVQICAIEGSAAAAGGKPGAMAPIGRALTTLAKVNEDIWYPQAQVAFSTATDQSIPVIADRSTYYGQVGDIELFLSTEAQEAADACTSAWQLRFPGRPGIPFVIPRSFFQAGLTAGVAPRPPRELQVASSVSGSGQRGDALCGYPVKLEPRDLVKPFVVIPDFTWDKFGNATFALAHELGHNLYLGHGNGLDDNGDGLSAGSPGPRRYDDYCDPGGAAEDVNNPTGCSLMHENACKALRPLQVETARGVAIYRPGFRDGTPAPVVVGPIG